MTQSQFSFATPRRHGQRAPDQQTSRDAMPDRERRATLEQQVLAYIRGRGYYGATDDELIAHFETQSVRPRRIDLEQRREVGDSGRKRKTRAGRLAIVWVTTGEANAVSD